MILALDGKQRLKLTVDPSAKFLGWALGSRLWSIALKILRRCEFLPSEVTRRQSRHGFEKPPEVRDVAEAPRIGNVADLPVDLSRISQRRLAFRYSAVEQKPL